MKIICYGDSNTWGYDPRGPFGSRYDAPWPEQLAEKTRWNVINQGENGRLIPRQPVDFPSDTDLLILMLGTNDLLELWSAEAACEKMERFLAGVSVPVLLIAPPPMIPGTWVQDPELIQDCLTLTARLESLAIRLGIRFLDAGKWQIPLAFDGVHLTEDGHRRFAQELYQYLTKGDNLC